MIIELTCRSLGSTDNYTRQAFDVDLTRSEVNAQGDDFFTALNLLGLEPHPNPKTTILDDGRYGD